MAMLSLVPMRMKRRPTIQATTPSQLGPVSIARTAARAACDPAPDHMAERNVARLLRAELDHLRARLDRVSRILDQVEQRSLFSDAELASIGGRL